MLACSELAGCAIVLRRVMSFAQGQAESFVGGGREDGRRRDDGTYRVRASMTWPSSSCCTHRGVPPNTSPLNSTSRTRPSSAHAKSPVLSSTMAL
ncbi:hypothetical protein SCHPADRAFT_750139 [Schizopora paradoxa]|uniref:Uncharacterized protein n=1 Tax=Schizopora paradoxa TaxID=27342 RepID=A0A0H2R523_9AGAM|nr:hypothetical protein SCHPADRAFT_750139 [Schizopora paradoxa]